MGYVSSQEGYLQEKLIFPIISPAWPVFFGGVEWHQTYPYITGPR